MNEKCGFCKHFVSYAVIYEDPLEDYEIGECHVDIIYPVPSEKCGIGYDDDACENWETNNDVI